MRLGIHHIAIGVSLALAALSVPASSFAQELARAKEAASSIHKEGNYPSELRRKTLTKDQLETPEALEKFLGKVFGGLGDAAKLSAPVATWAFVVIAVVLGGLVLVAIIRLRPNIELAEKKRVKNAKAVDTPQTHTPGQKALSEEELDALLAAGKLQEAVTYLLRLMIHDLGYDQNVEQESLTPREVSAVIKSESLETAVRIAERIAFAGNEAKREQVDQLLGLRQQLCARLGKKALSVDA